MTKYYTISGSRGIYSMREDFTAGMPYVGNLSGLLNKIKNIIRAGDFQINIDDDSSKYLRSRIKNFINKNI